MSPAQVQELSANLIGQLSVEQVAQLQPTQVAAMSNAQFAALDTAQLISLAHNGGLNAITPDQLAQVEWQAIAEVPASRFADLTDAQLSTFSREQLSQLTAPQLNSLGVAGVTEVNLPLVQAALADMSASSVASHDQLSTLLSPVIASHTGSQPIVAQVTGQVVAGPVVSDHDMVIQAYSMRTGQPVMDEPVHVNADGTYTLTITGFEGPAVFVLTSVSDTYNVSNLVEGTYREYGVDGEGNIAANAAEMQAYANAQFSNGQVAEFIRDLTPPVISYAHIDFTRGHGQNVAVTSNEAGSLYVVSTSAVITNAQSVINNSINNILSFVNNNPNNSNAPRNDVVAGTNSHYIYGGDGSGGSGLATPGDYYIYVIDRSNNVSLNPVNTFHII